MVENQYIIDISTNTDPTSIEVLKNKLQTATDNADGLNNSLENINSDGIDELANSAEEVSYTLGYIDETGNEVSYTISNKGDAVGDATAGLDDAANSASGLKEQSGKIDPSGVK